MRDERDRLFALLAYQSGFATRSALLEAMEEKRKGRRLESALKSRMKEEEMSAVRAVVDAQLQASGGDVSLALSRVAVDDDLQRVLDGRPPAAVTEIRSPGRYKVGRELGKGGLGRVVEAYDTSLKRDVALKLVIDALSPDLRERFIREAELAGSLEHPNIVPVHDFGELPASGGEPRLFLCMKRVQGRDLGSLLERVAKGDADVASKYTRPRLLAIFQDVCLGAAFAHSRGVIHRDFKPANVMIGEFGEVHIVDWGLARRVGGSEPPRDRGRTTIPGVRPRLTLDGDVLGTPGYMPPEQAEGRLDDLDARSDIFALGAMLYEILTNRPPFCGDSVAEILERAKACEFSPPATFDSSVPAELEAIVLRAMARRPADRHPDAMALHHDVQLFLEGVRDRERRAREAGERAAEGRRALNRFRDLRAEVASQEDAVEELEAHPSKETPLWQARERCEILQESRIRAFTQANVAFSQALVADPGCADARDGQRELYYDRLVEAEEVRDRAEELLARSMLLGLDQDGKFRAKLEAPGRLTIRAFARDCDCLRPVRARGWSVRYAEAATLPWRDGRALKRGRLNEGDLPVPAVKIAGGRWGHSEDCAKREVAGAEVWIAKYERVERRLRPGEAKRLGVTPLVDATLPQGSWLCTLRPAAPLAPVTFPVVVSRDGRWTQDVFLFRAEDIPDGMLQVPAGPFTFGGPWAGGEKPQAHVARDLFVSRFPVTCAEYLEFLDALPAAEAKSRQPRDGGRGLWIRDKRGFRLPKRTEDRNFSWAPRWPVVGISWFDALAFAGWRSTREGRVYRLLHESEYEKSARGVDGRVFPFGDEYDPSCSHTSMSLAKPAPVGTFPLDESPFGIRDLAGGASTWCFNGSNMGARIYACYRGGAWTGRDLGARSGYRQGITPEATFVFLGLRLAMAPER